MELDKEVFQGKKIEDIVKEVYNKHQEQDALIKNEIFRLSEMITSPGEALAVSPLIKPLIDSSLKNDEVLVKILNLFQKAQTSDGKGQDEGLFTEKDLEQLWSTPTAYTKEIKSIENGV